MSGPLSVESRISAFDLREKGNCLASVNISPFSVDQQNIRSVAILGLVQFSDWNRTWIFFVWEAEVLNLISLSPEGAESFSNFSSSELGASRK